MNDNEDIWILDISLITTGLFIISLIISMSVIYNEKLNRLNKPAFYTSDESAKITLGNKWFILILSLVFLYINYESVRLAKQKGSDCTLLNLQVLASILALIAAFIALYVTSESVGGGDSLDILDIEEENPEL